MPNIGPMEIGIVLVIALVVFGPKRLPELGKSLGKGIRELRGSIGGDNDEPAIEAPAEAAVVAKPVAVAKPAAVAKPQA